MTGATKGKSLSASLAAARVLLLLVVTLLLGQTRVWAFAAPPQPASGQIALASPSPIGKITTAWAYDASDCHLSAESVAPTVEQYALRAADSGFYPVMTRTSKAPTGITWLDKGDVWKFGTTKNPSTRYSQSYLDSIGDHGVLYRTEWQGTASEALQLEKMKIMNFQSQTGGVLPAGNKIVR